MADTTWRDLVEGACGGERRALARLISRVESREPGWQELVVVNPWPLHPEIGQEWGDGTSNAAHLIVRFAPE